MASAVTNPGDDRRLLTLAGAEVATTALRASTACAVDYACVVDVEAGAPTTEPAPHEPSLTDDVLAVLRDVQRLAKRLATLG